MADEHTLKFRGLSVGKRYEVRIEPLGEFYTVNGQNLTETGITVRLDTALTSQLILAKEISLETAGAPG